MKKLKLIILSVLLCTTLNAQVPLSFNVSAGDSPTNGLLGAEFEVSRFALGAGWRPATPKPNHIDSYSIVFTVYSNELDPLKSTIPGARNYLYLSSAYTTAAFLYEDYNNPGKYKPVPGVIILVGMRSFFLPHTCKRLSGKCGIGLNINESESQFAFEFGFNFSLFNNSKKY